MLEQVSPLWDVYIEKKQQGQALVLATLVKTTGSSYKKAGAMMLVEQDKTTHGLLSGGCLEADVAEHAMVVFAEQQAQVVNYDMSDDSIFGLGAGCDGTLTIVLQLISGDYLPFSALNPRPGHASTTQLFINGDSQANHSVGDYWIKKEQKVYESTTGFHQATQPCDDVMVFDVPPKVVICGAGTDVIPLMAMMHIVHWHLILIDHRPGRLKTELYPAGTELIGSQSLADAEQHSDFEADAVVIMSHNIDRDAAYINHFNQTAVPWIGLLGPQSRRDKVLAKAHVDIQDIEHKLHAPVGLDIGGHMPEHIAVSIVAQLQGYFNCS